MGQLFKDLFNFVYSQNSIICELSNLQSSNIYLLFALVEINNASLNVGDVYQDVNDSLASIVYKQDPDPVLHTKLPLGSFISVWTKDSIINE